MWLQLGHRAVGLLALLEIDSVGCTLNHTFVINFLFSLNFSLQPFHSESVKALVTLGLLTGELREALNHQVWTIHGLTFLQGLFPAGSKEFFGMEHQDFPLWAFNPSCGCPALQSKELVSVKVESVSQAWICWTPYTGDHLLNISAKPSWDFLLPRKTFSEVPTL